MNDRDGQLKARPTIYKGIKMRSRLEAGFATWLDKHHFEWEYEPYALATEDGQYLPDFRLNNASCIWLPEPVTLYVEVKPEDHPIHDTSDEAWRIQQQATIVRASGPNGRMVIARPGNGLHLMVTDAPDAPEAPGYWCPAHLDLIKLPEGRIGFGLGTPPKPWAGEYWKPGRS